MLSKKITIIGSGFSALSASCYLAKAGFQVSIYEKNEKVGGRASQFKREGFTFDMGPSWYWMPDIFESFFNDFNKKVANYYSLSKLNTAYNVYFDNDHKIAIGGHFDEIINIFEKEENGSAVPLKRFISKAERYYKIAMADIVYRPGLSPFELITPQTIKNLGAFFTTIKKEVNKNFKAATLRKILQFPVLFLGAKPSKTPAFYSFMNFADFILGTWHPVGGMYVVVKAIEKLAKELGVKIYTNSPVDKIEIKNKKAEAIIIGKKKIFTDIVLSGADYYHTETLLDKKYRSYSEKYWQKKIFAPSCLLFFIGINKKVANLSHHNLFFDTDFDAHSYTIYDAPQWAKNPLFYANFPSITDSTMAPKGKENGFILIPIASGIEDNLKIRDIYFKKVIERIELRTKQSIREHIIFKQSYCINNFIKDYNSYKGNAYGLANTLFQTAFLRPKLKSKKIKNLYFTGQLTVPGPGVPPALISGKIVANLIQKNRRF